MRACRAFLDAEGVDEWGEVRPPERDRLLLALFAYLVVGYLATRGPVASGPLFVGVHGRRLSQTVMKQTFGRYARPQAPRLERAKGTEATEARAEHPASARRPRT